MKTNTKTSLVIGAAMIMIGSTIATASSDIVGKSEQSVAAAEGMSIELLIGHLKGLGYTAFREVERERDYYEVEARDSENREV
ncbi:MAG: hypothetical protein P8N43_12190, partial [Alphaproteobacteria bacterium]|nr:hypothetical protein [Alphaproteobacteria bacterium]